jgi:hypothetical protein
MSDHRANSSINKVKPVGPARPSMNATKSVPVHTVSSVTRTTTASKVYPKSLSVVEMLKLGEKIEQSSSMIDIFKFSLSQMTWSKMEWNSIFPENLLPQVLWCYSV